MNLIHIGLPKTGTTTLQNAVFPRQTRFSYIGKINNRYSPELRDLVTRISFQDSLEYDPSVVEALAERQRDHSKPSLISDEIFSVEGRADRRLVAERLHHLFAPAKVLIVLRAQPSMLQSMYLNHVRGSDERVGSFSSWLDKNYGSIRFADLYRIGLNYEPLVRTYEEVFGTDNVVVLPFELLRDPDSLFAATIADLVGMAPEDVKASLARNVDNQRMSRRHLRALYLQALLPKGTNLALAGRRLLPDPVYAGIRNFVTAGRRMQSPDLPEGWLARIAKQCAPGNAAIEARRRIPLKALGYPAELRAE